MSTLWHRVNLRDYHGQVFMNTPKLYKKIVTCLERAGRNSPYESDANEPDTRYRGYGVRAPEMKGLLAGFRNELKALLPSDSLELAIRLVESGFGEQKTVALFLFEKMVDYFEPENFELLDHIFRNLHGWSKIDAFTGLFLRQILLSHPEDSLNLVNQWNNDNDVWLRRASVVLFTRKVASSGQFTDNALRYCDHLKFDTEDLVQTGVGWCLKDLRQCDKARILPYIVDLRKQNVSSTITLYALRGVKGKERERILKL